MSSDVAGSGGSPGQALVALAGEPRSPRRRVPRVDVMRLLAESSRTLVAAAAHRAAEAGSVDLDTGHLLWAAAREPSTRRLLRRAGAEPEALARTLEENFADGPACDRLPALTPAAKRAVLDAHQLARVLGSTHIRPDHLVLALAVDLDSPAGCALHAAHVTTDSLRAAMAPLGRAPVCTRVIAPL